MRVDVVDGEVFEYDDEWLEYTHLDKHRADGCLLYVSIRTVWALAFEICCSRKLRYNK